MSEEFWVSTNESQEEMGKERIRSTHTLGDRPRDERHGSEQGPAVGRGRVMRLRLFNYEVRAWNGAKRHPASAGNMHSSALEHV